MHDYLTPVEGLFFDHSYSYLARVRETLLADFSSTPLGGLVGLPTFKPEYALWIGKDWRRYYAVCRIANSSIWQASQNPLAAPVTFSTHNAELPAELAQALETVFWIALGQTRYAEQPAIVLDGISYYVTAFKASSGLRSGQTQVPAPSSNLGELLNLTEMLMQHITSSATSPHSWTKLIEVARTLQAKFSGT